MDEKINGNVKTKQEMTHLLCTLFKTSVYLNSRCFKGMSIPNVIDTLCNEVDISDLCIDREFVKALIQRYAERYDLGIYY